MDTENEIFRKELKALREMQTQQTRLMPFETTNGLIFGPQGSGKTFVTTLMLTDFLTDSKDNQVIVVDYGGSYRKLCKIFGGQYLEIGRPNPKTGMPSFDCPEHARISVFDLHELHENPDIQPTIFSSLSSVIEVKLKDQSLKTLIVIDECATIFHDETGSRFMLNLYRTARKYNAMVLSITQSPSDFLRTQVSDSILVNTSLLYVLSSAWWTTTNLGLLPKFGFSQKEIKKVKNLRVTKTSREIFRKSGGESRVIKIEPSKLDYWICTTFVDDWRTENKLREQHPDWSEIQILKELAGLNKKDI